MRIRDTQLEALAAKGNRRAKMARHIVAHIDSYISATQFGITLASMGLGVVVEPVFRDLLEPAVSACWTSTRNMPQRGIAIGVGFFVNCYLLIVAGELVPKAIAIRRTLPDVAVGRRPVELVLPDLLSVHLAAAPLVAVRVAPAGHFPRKSSDSVHSEEELRLVFASRAQGAAGGRNIILNALDLRHRIAREVMRPRHEITAFDTEATLAECLALAEKTRYSRFPLCEDGDLDKTRGVVHIKDLYALRDKARTAADLLPVGAPVDLRSGNRARWKNCCDLFLERKLHFAIVVDEYGGTVGIVTLENVIEALVGQIQDEFDQEKSELTVVGENVWEAAGTLPLHELEKIIGDSAARGSVATASGWVTEKLGGFPKAGDVLTVGACELRVEEMDGPRVARLKITRHAGEENTDSP